MQSHFCLKADFSLNLSKYNPLNKKMDEQQDQAVLEMEEIETDTDYDYLSILREMQQSLSDDKEVASIFKTVEDEDDSTVSVAESALPPMLSAENLIAETDDFARSQNENAAQAADSFTDAPTQPLPELPTDFSRNLESNSSLNTSQTESSVETELNPNDEMTARNEDSFSLASAPLENTDQVSNEENNGTVETDNRLFGDFDEISPILFDASEQEKIAEPDFDLEFFAGVSTEPTSESAANGFSADLPETGWATVSESASDDAASRTDEMPLNLAFSEMFGNNLEQPNADFAPPVETGEDEAQTAPLPQHLVSDELAPVESLSEPATPDFDQHFAEPNLLDETNEKSGAVLASDVSAESDLPDSIFLAAGESDFAFPDSFGFLNADPQEEAPVDEIMEPDFSDAESEETETDALGLSIPWFLREELAAKHSVSEDNFPELSFAEDNLADETEQTELIAKPDETAVEIPAAPLVAENINETEPETEQPALHEATAGKNGFNRFISPPEANQLADTSSFEDLTDNFSETRDPEDLPQSFLTAPLENEFGLLSESVSDEIPEALLLRDSDAPMPEPDPVNFDPTPAPEFEDTELQFTEPLTDSAVIAEVSEQESANQNSLPGKYQQLGKASFLEERFVIFKLDDTLYAFPAVNVAEIGQLLPITPLPFVPSWFLGISHLRGDIVSVVGLRELWQKNTAVPHKAKILIVHSEKQHLTIALVVDAVREMRHVTPEEIVSDESRDDSHFAPYQIGTVNYDGQNLCLLNAEKLLETLRS